MTGVILRKDTETQKDDRVKKQREYSRPQKESSVRRKQPCPHLHLGLPAARMVRNKFLLSHLVCNVCYGNPSKQTHSPQYSTAARTPQMQDVISVTFLKLLRYLPYIDCHGTLASPSPRFLLPSDISKT